MLPNTWTKVLRSLSSCSPRKLPRGAFLRRSLLLEHLEDRCLLSLTPTLTTLIAPPAQVAVGEALTLTATVTASPPSSTTPSGGSVTFLDGNTALGTVAVTSGTASLPGILLPAGTQVLSAMYSGDGTNFAASTTTVGPNSIITTVAGQYPGYSGNGGPAIAARLNWPAGIALDSAGDLFIADSSNNVIREVDHATGVITTVAGNGRGGYSGDGGPATAAELHDPTGVAVDAAGDLFIADSLDSRIREVNHATGVITTVAGCGVWAYGGDGGPATAAYLEGPYGVALDAAGDLFIADTDNNAIREVDHATGMITTVAGNGRGGYSGDDGPATAAELGDPTGVAVDAAGDVFIADDANQVVREVNLATGVITTVAGNGRGSYSGDGGPATAAELYYPSGVALDSAGDLFIADVFNGRIREVNHATGVITTVAGDGGLLGEGYVGPATTAGLGFVCGVAVDSAGNLFIPVNGNAGSPNYASMVCEVASGAIVSVRWGDGTSVTTSTNPSVYGLPVTFTATVAATQPGNGTPTGTVTFSNGGTLLGTGNLDANGIATFSTETLTGGTHTITASYAGDANFIATSGNVTETVNQDTTTMVVSASANQSVYSQPVTFTATVAAAPSGAGTPTGTVTFSDDGTLLGTGSLDANGNATFSTDTLATGTHTITVSYTGDADFTATSGSVTQTVNQDATTMAVSASANPSVYSQPVTFTANVAATPPGAGTPAGTVTFSDDGTLLGTVNLDDNGNATFSITTLTLGTHTITASYAGDADFTATSGSVTQTVNQESTNTVVSASPNPSAYGQPVTFTATVAATPPGAGTPTGTVTFNDGDTLLGTAPLEAGTATLTDSSLDAGTHEVTAFYGGDGANFFASTSGTVGPNSIITTVAGGGIASGVPATTAQLNSPSDVAVDAAGDLFIADSRNNVIREVNPNGVITTVAGNGTPGYSGDGHQATAAELNDPSYVAVDSSGDLFIADFGNSVIREVNPSTGVITTVAGNGTPGYSGDGYQATAAELNSPQGIALDSAGDLFIADTGNQRIREVNFLTGVITTVAGFGGGLYGGDGGPATAARLCRPAGIALDSAGDLFIADTGNSVIREVDHATGVITTVAGNRINMWSYSGDGGPATDAGLNQPMGIAVDSTGDLFIADTGNSVIREVNPATGVITTVTDAFVSNPRGLAVDAAGDLFIADTGNNRVREVASTSGTVGPNSIITTVAGGGIGEPLPATAVELGSPQAMAVDAAGDLFIADNSNNVILEVNLSSGIINTVAGNYALGAGYSGDTGQATAAQLSGPSGVALDGQGGLFIADTGNNVVREVNLSSSAIACPGAATLPPVRLPRLRATECQATAATATRPPPPN